VRNREKILARATRRSRETERTIRVPLLTALLLSLLYCCCRRNCLASAALYSSLFLPSPLSLSLSLSLLLSTSLYFSFSFCAAAGDNPCLAPVRSRFRSFAGNPRGRRSHGYCRIWQGEATAPSRAQPVALSPAILPRTLLPPSPPRCAPHGRKCQYPLSRCARDAPSRLDAPSVCRSPRSCPLLAAFHTPADLSSLCSRVLSLCSAFAVILSRFSQRVFSPPPSLSLSLLLSSPPPLPLSF